MFLRTTAACLALMSVLSSVSFSQQSPSSPAIPGVTELPVIMQQDIAAGKTLVGTKVRANLQVATLVNGTVIPRNATLHGEVIESTAKTKTSPSILAIRIDSAQWKNGSTAIKAYLTAWYYPAIGENGQDLQYGPPQSPRSSWNGQGAYPSNSPAYKPFPGSDPDVDKNSVPDATASKTSNRHVLIKDAELMGADDGTLVVVSKRSNIKLDKLTTYVLAAGAVALKK